MNIAAASAVDDFVIMLIYLSFVLHFSFNEIEKKEGTPEEVGLSDFLDRRLVCV